MLGRKVLVNSATLDKCHANEQCLCNCWSHSLILGSSIVKGHSCLSQSLVWSHDTVLGSGMSAEVHQKLMGRPLFLLMRGMMLLASHLGLMGHVPGESSTTSQPCKKGQKQLASTPPSYWANEISYLAKHFLVCVTDTALCV